MNQKTTRIEINDIVLRPDQFSRLFEVNVTAKRTRTVKSLEGDQQVYTLLLPPNSKVTTQPREVNGFPRAGEALLWPLPMEGGYVRKLRWVSPTAKELGRLTGLHISEQFIPPVNPKKKGKTSVAHAL